MSLQITNKNGLTISSIGSTGTSGNPSHPLVYEPTSQKVTYSTAKTFVIDHPDDQDKFLVHACLEGPEAGVYYRGKASIENDKCVTIVLPKYVEKLANNFTVHLTLIYDESCENENLVLRTTEVEKNSFKVYGKNCKFFWIVYGERQSINVEPLKNSSDVLGEGPYRWVK
jgi:hypothetical protein